MRQLHRVLVVAIGLAGLGLFAACADGGDDTDRVAGELRVTLDGCVVIDETPVHAPTIRMVATAGSVSIREESGQRTFRTRSEVVVEGQRQPTDDVRTAHSPAVTDPCFADADQIIVVERFVDGHVLDEPSGPPFERLEGDGLIPVGEVRLVGEADALFAACGARPFPLEINGRRWDVASETDERRLIDLLTALDPSLLPAGAEQADYIGVGYLQEDVLTVSLPNGPIVRFRPVETDEPPCDIP